MHHSITYVEEDRIAIRFWTLVIHLPSLNRDIGLLRDFAGLHRCWGETNGRIWWMVEENAPPHTLYQIIDEFLKPHGMRNYIDYTIFQELNLYKPKEQYPDILNKPIAGLERVPWLDSWIDSDGKQWVWWKKIK